MPGTRARTPTLTTMSTPTIDVDQDVTDTGASGGCRFSLTGAADATGTSKRTILRHIDELTRHGAEKDSTGAWSIPLAALLASGFKVGAPRTSDTEQPAPERAPHEKRNTNPQPSDELDELRTELATVRAELVTAQHRAALLDAERSAALAVAAEREKHVDSLRVALRALEPAPQPQRLPTVVEPYKPKLWRKIVFGI